MATSKQTSNSPDGGSDSELLDSWASSATFDDGASSARRERPSPPQSPGTSRVSALFSAGKRAMSATGALIRGLSESIPDALAGPEPASPEVENILLHLRQLLAELLLDMSGSADASSVTVGILSDIRVKKCLDEAVLATTTLDELADALLDIWYVSRFDDGVLSNWSQVSQIAWLQQLFKVTVGTEINNVSVLSVRLGIHLLISAIYQLGMAIMGELEGETFERWRACMSSLLERVENLGSSCGDKAAGNVFFSPLAFVAYYDDTLMETEGRPRNFKLATLAESRNKTVVDTRLFINSVEDGSGTYLPDIDSSALIAEGRSSSRRPTLIPPVGDAELEEQTKRLAKELFVRKTQPITLINRHSAPLTARLYNRMDQICAIPVGGLKGPGVGTAKEGKRIQLRPPSSHDVFWLKVSTPGTSGSIYNCEVHRGQTWELRGHNASLLVDASGSNRT